jgi:deoxycytidine triphosphate deaminase
LLNNKEIASLIASHGLIQKHDRARIEPASYDLVIGTIFHGGQIINAGHPRAKESVVIGPGEVVTMLSFEELNLPSDICATAYAMNAQSSEGLLVLNPGHVDPGYQGPLTIVALNLRKVPLALQLGERIFTVVFAKLPQAADPPYRKNTSARDVVERAVNKKVVEKSIGSLAQLLSISERDINNLIKEHWLSRAAFVSTVLAAAAGVVAAVFAFIAVLPASRDASRASAEDTRTNLREPSTTSRPLPSASAEEPRIKLREAPAPTKPLPGGSGLRKTP